ncbi:MAG: hypothetical protein ABL973_04630 [Micropepsaceae bacterium]
MKALLAFLANAVGGFSAAFLAYVATGSALGLVLAKSYVYGNPHECWPIADQTCIFTSDGCENQWSKSLWFLAVHAPKAQIAALVIAMHDLTTTPIKNPEYPGSYIVIDRVNTFAGSAILMCVGLIGFLAWHQRSPPVAWTFYTLLLGQVAFLYLHLKVLLATQ